MIKKQAVADKVQEIAKRFTKEPEKSIYQNAADRFRLPFWDPLLPRNKVSTAEFSQDMFGMPKILGAKTVHVKIPKEDGSVVTNDAYKNPLYSFIFPETEILQEKGRQPISWPGDDPDDTPVVSELPSRQFEHLCLTGNCSSRQVEKRLFGHQHPTAKQTSMEYRTRTLRVLIRWFRTPSGG
jgi:hypothetical protein